jgi:hypothetical protein
VIEGLVGSLPDDARELIALRMVDPSLAEIAKAIVRPRSDVEARLWELERWIRDELAVNGITPEAGEGLWAQLREAMDQLDSDETGDEFIEYWTRSSSAPAHRSTASCRIGS